MEGTETAGDVGPSARAPENGLVVEETREGSVGSKLGNPMRGRKSGVGIFIATALLSPRNMKLIMKLTLYVHIKTSIRRLN